MSTMTEWLSTVYNTAPEQQDESTEKNAQAELFAKLAADRGIDLSKLPAETVNELYEQTFGEKVAGEMPPQFAKKDKGDDKDDDDKDDDKDEEKKASAYFLEKRAFAARMEEADFMGRVMAHSFTQELGNIKTASAKTAGEMPPQFAANAAKKKDDDKDEKKDDGEKKEASSAAAFETAAQKHAVKIASAANYNVEEAAARVSGVALLGLIGESEKIAHVTTPEAAIHVRALEYLEAAKYPVDWQEVFGQG